MDHLEEKSFFQNKKLKHKKIMHLTNFIFTQTFFLIASYQISKNDVILMNHGSFFQEKDSLQLKPFQFVYKNFVFENWLLMVSAIKEVISENWERQSCEDSFTWKNDSWFIRIVSFCKIWYEAIRNKIRQK